MKVYTLPGFSPVAAHQPGAQIASSKTENLYPPLFTNDAAFDSQFPQHFQMISPKHWTPLAVAHIAAGFLAGPGARVLDIGSGIGKFCLAAGFYFPETYFYGVEQRQELIYLAEQAKQCTQLHNVNFIYANITQVNFKGFDHFYFYNSFYENIDTTNQIDDTIEISEGLYTYYTQYLHSALDEKPPGTRVVTFHSLEQEIPSSYKLAAVACNALLKMWIKA
ncbi:methyltransferase domain-containing protein [Mucilaginibacter sp.]|uniref:methyltransferase domain-containing protein n=1 Tax=Mucilaginibacter sp. TaxID=1882438 RepID=UPI0025CFF5A4|nr:methyltransferase domain-containing protein [Mucilaginibacter sp.]